MYLTEQEAIKRWCPFVRLWEADDALGCAATNRGIVQSRGWCNCIASECMAWREVGYEERTSKGCTDNVAVGYCGIAGNPVTP